MRDKVKWGIIGSGGIAKRRTIPEGFVPSNNAGLVSVYGTNAKTNKEVANQFGAKAVDTLDALFASGIDAVYVASPVHAHLEQVLACARAGKHVLCEKPLGRNVAEAEEMAAACRRAGVQFGTAFMMRFHTQHQAAAEIIRAGKMGKPVFARAQLSCWYPPMPKAWRQDPALAGGGALMDLAGHCIDVLEMCFGPVKEVSCFAGNVVHNYASDDGAVTLLQFANGAFGTVDTFFCIQDSSSKNALELYGSQGSIHATGTIGQGSQGEMICQLQSGETGYEAQQERTASGGVKISPEPKNIYRAEIEAFSQSVLDGRPNPHQAIELGLHSQKVLAACYESSRTRKAITIPQ
ncbi:MAG TPA: Gfo/Idh/MocA family oxidoreductase [Verrucomicrobiae bacterium]|nr:Gfo/Idh/MocA family oxidoreductase [Verrucomicrobiae bacterium]